MTDSPADVVRWILVALGVGTDPELGSAWPVYCSSEPDRPDNSITVYDTDGTDNGRTMVDGKLQRLFGFQVRVRSDSHGTGWTKADAIQTALAESVYQETVTVNGRSYLVHAVSRIGDVLPLGKESPTSKRSLFTLNAGVTVRPL